MLMTTRVTPELGLLAERVAQLEKQNRLFKRIGLVLTVLLGGAALVAAQERGNLRTIEADRFLLKDANGRVRADLSVDKSKNSTQLLLNDENEKVRLNVSVFPEGPGIAMFDENGAIRYTVSHSARGPAMVFNDENQKPRAMMRISKEGPVLTFLDDKEIDRLMLTFTKANGGSVDMYEAGKQHSMALRASGGVNGLAIFDETGQPRATMVQRPRVGPRIELLDENNQPLFQQPPKREP
jgi:hypothetical protein